MGDQFLWDTVDFLKIMDIWTEKLNVWNTPLVLEFWSTVSAFCWEFVYIHFQILGPRSKTKSILKTAAGEGLYMCFI